MMQSHLHALGLDAPSARDVEMPSNVQAEQAVLGTLMANNKTFGAVAEILEPRHFFDGLNGRIYAEIAKRVLAGNKADLVTLANWFKADPQSGDVGGAAYLADLVATMAGAASVADYAREVRSCWVRREAITAAQSLIDAAHANNGDVEASLGDLNRTIDAAIAGMQVEAVSFDVAMTRAMANVRQAMAQRGAVGLNIGPDFPRTRRLLRFIDGKFILLGGDTGVGKSAIGWKWAINAARDLDDQLRLGRPMSEVGGILGISLEMQPESIALRAACSFAGVPYDDCEAGTISDTQLEFLESAKAALGKLPIMFIAVGGMTPAMIKMRARQAQRKFGGKLAGIIVDHLQLMEADGDVARAGGAYAMRSIANAMIGLPKLFNCPLIALSQLRAEVQERKNKRPHRGDYSWGQAIGQAADAALFVYREDYYLHRAKPFQEVGEPPCAFQDRMAAWQAAMDRAAGKAELIIDKVRGGASNQTVSMMFDGPTMTFSEDPGQ